MLKSCNNNTLPWITPVFTLSIFPLVMTLNEFSINLNHPIWLCFIRPTFLKISSFWNRISQFKLLYTDLKSTKTMYLFYCLVIDFLIFLISSRIFWRFILFHKFEVKQHYLIFKKYPKINIMIGRRTSSISLVSLLTVTINRSCDNFNIFPFIFGFIFL